MPAIVSEEHDLPPAELFDNFHVVLLEPSESLNVGSVARAMMNLGFSNLHLVAPPAYDPKVAAKTACWAADILANAVEHATLEEALAPMNDVIGFSSTYSKDRRMHLLLPEWTGTLKCGSIQKTALLFGTERTGLQKGHIEHCRLLVRIPSAARNPSFNLSQSVLLVLFELSRLQWPEISTSEDREMADWNDLYQLDRLLDAALTEAEFYTKDSPPAVRSILKNILRRANPDKREVGILLALFSHLRTTIKRLQQ